MGSFIRPAFSFPFAPHELNQPINPWSNFLNAIGNQYSFVSINLGQSSAPEVERKVLDSVGSYGRQLGQVCDALMEIVQHFDMETKLEGKHRDAITKLRLMVEAIDQIKQNNGR